VVVVAVYKRVAHDGRTDIARTNDRSGAGARAVHRAADPAALGRAGYAYAHAIMVAGVIVVAVGIDRTIHHPTGSTEAETAWVVLAGPAIYLAGMALFKYTLWNRIPWPPLIGIVALALLALLALAVNPLVLSAAAALVTVSFALTAAAPDRLETIRPDRGAAARGDQLPQDALR
jgi:low temperature requirement protein LtrA